MWQYNEKMSGYNMKICIFLVRHFMLLCNELLLPGNVTWKYHLITEKYLVIIRNVSSWHIKTYSDNATL